MLYKRIKTIAASVVLVLAAGACTDGFDELNTNPTLITEDKVAPQMLFTYVVKNSVFGTFSPGRLHEFSGYLGNEASGNILQNTDYTSPFNQYRSFIINLNEVIRLTKDDPAKSDQVNIARIFRAWNYHMITDAYGDIPYHDAALGIDQTVNQPKYDTQEEIYRHMMAELKDAANALGTVPNQVSFGAADLLYKGDVEKWRKFANSLRLRLAIRVRFVAPQLAKEQIDDLLAKPMIIENADNAALLTMEPAQGVNNSNVNPIWVRYNVNAGGPYYAGLPVTDIMVPTNDPRLPLIANPIEKDGVTFRGRPLQLLQAQKEEYRTDSTSHLGPYMSASTYNIIIFNASETHFLRAEAALAGITAEDENTLYRRGIELSMERFEIDAAPAADFLAQPVATLQGTEEEQLEQIIEQKWVANYFQAAEGWAEFRRTGYPQIWMGEELGSTNGNIPRRMTYPTDEYLKNEANVTAAVGRLSGGDNLMSRIWWDVRPGLPYAHPLQGNFPPN